MAYNFHNSNIFQHALISATSATIPPQQLRQQIEQIRPQGYAWTFDELEVGRTTAAGPIYNHKR